MKKIIVKSFNGIGDLLFATPSFKVIKESYPDSYIVVNTNRPSLLKGNPYIDKIGFKNEGLFLKYPAPDGNKLPYQHHILSDWEIICKEYKLKTELPNLYPELYLDINQVKTNLIGVQVKHKRYYHGKRVWPHFEELSMIKGFEPIPEISRDDFKFAEKINSYKLIVCPEGGVSHLAAALGVKALVLFGGFSDPIWTGYNKHINLVSNIECKHCFNMSPCVNNFNCWNEFSLKYVEELLDGKTK